MLKLRLPFPRFFSAREIIHGTNSIAALKGLQVSRVALIVGNSLLNNTNYFERLCKMINAFDVQVINRSWKGEPTLDELQNPLSELETFQPDCIIAVGGGSILDGAKIIWALYEHPETELKKLSRPFALPPLRGRSKFVAIPTTIGSGSEVSSTAVLYEPNEKIKIPVVTHDFLPDLVILEPGLLTQLPRQVLISTMVDAVTHSIEGRVSKINNPLMNVFSEKSLEIIARSYTKLEENPEDEMVLGELQYASMMAGWVQNHCMVGICHALAHQMSAYLIPHGIANSLFICKTIRINQQSMEALESYEQLVQRAGIGKRVEDLISWLEELIAIGQYSVSLRDYQKENGSVSKDQLIENALNDPVARVNPIEATPELFHELWESAL